ncbi:MAG: hypothetical protein IIW07_01880 [Clostridia bacterium]|nr:hypothetical protein [Clostridia bacterium]MBQ5772228.1 hypothetical protein [Clostridia bacterium]
MKRKIQALIPWQAEKSPSDQAQNPYYERVSERLGVFQVILYFSLFAFVVLSFFSNTELITYQNFYRFFKDLNASVEGVDVINTDSVSYPTDTEQSFTLYRNGLAVAGNHSVTIFTAAGRQTVSKTVSYQHPVAVGTGKYLLVYELGGVKYSLYNSYTQVYAGETAYPISGAAVSDSGMYALISSSAQYVSEVYLYNDNFTLINRYARSGYVTDVAINEKGTLLALLTSDTHDGVFSTEVALCEPGEREFKATADVGTAIGLSCVFTEGNTLSVLTAEGVYALNQNGRVLRSHSFDGLTLACASCTADGITVALRDSVMSTEDTVILFGKDGRLLFKERFAEGTTQISRSGSTAFLLSSDGIRAVRGGNGTSSFYPTQVGAKIMLAIGRDEVLLCTAKKAEYVQIPLR